MPSEFCRRCGAPRVGAGDLAALSYQDDVDFEMDVSSNNSSATGVTDDTDTALKRWICTPPNWFVEWWFENVNCWIGGYGGLKNPKLRAFAGDDFSVFNQTMNLVIVANVTMMACEHFGQPNTVTNGIQTANVVFTLVFLVETVFKLVVLGPGEMLEYGRSAINVIDFCVVIVSTISLVFSSSSSASASVLRLLKLGRALRVLRISRVSKRWHQLVAVVQLMQSSVSRVWPMLFLLLLFLFMSTILAMQLFGEIERDGNLGFKTFGQSISMAFFVLTLEDWGDVLEFTNNNHGNGIHALYLIGVVLVG